MTIQPDAIPLDEAVFGEPLTTDELRRLIRQFDDGSLLKPLDCEGVFLWWSDQIPSWVHPEDVQLAESLVPGFRIFRRTTCRHFADRELGYFEFHYGAQFFRGFPVLWRRVPQEGFQVGQTVEIRSNHGKRRPRMAAIGDKTWNRQSGRIEYRLTLRGVVDRRHFLAHELRPAAQLSQPRYAGLTTLPQSPEKSS